MTDTLLQTPFEDYSGAGESYQFTIRFTCVLMSEAVFAGDHTPAERVGEPTYSSRLGWEVFDGSWEYVAARVATDASTSSNGSLVRSLEGDPHPKPLAAARVRRLKNEFFVVFGWVVVMAPSPSSRPPRLLGPCPDHLGTPRTAVPPLGSLGGTKPAISPSCRLPTTTPPAVPGRR